ncbi:metal ABC transporter solute-binding protein, Zn/Mn family [Sediminibacillus albus]|uniref:Zinc transport system substrate-binding protein n=1 Tax=Sediminibacillus albus TaxID=407036 RepID=A0A1G8ZRS7_9BACI|nr:zinc ABC transporter substrate-binding protein [Sediminibacillus albus]SDK16860.1 zinc transport system substrate-binding protein [Sediminibacillus albus]
MKKGLLWLAAAIVAFLAGCGAETVENEGNADSEEKLAIYTTLYPLQDFTEKIGGDLVQVESLLAPGTDAHTFEPTSNTMVDIAQADAFIYLEAGLESYADKIAGAVKTEDVSMLEAGNGSAFITSAHDHHHEEEADHSDHDHGDDAHAHEEDEAGEEEHDHGDFDPHIWLDPNRSIGLAENIKDELVSLMPEQEKVFNENFEKLKAQLESLDEEFHQIEQEYQDKQILVSHAAFGYWENAYGIEQIAVSGVSTASEPSQKQLEYIIDEAREHDLHYILFEQNVTPRVAEVVQKEVGAETLRIHNLAVLTEEDIQNEEDYFSLMEQNLETLKIALQ